MTTDDWITVQVIFDKLAHTHESPVLMRVAMCIRSALMRQIKTQGPFLQHLELEIEKEFSKEREKL